MIINNEVIEKNKLNTPSYVFDEDELISRVRRIKEICKGAGMGLTYAIKANPYLIPLLIDEVEHFEICSPGELEICRHYEVPGEKIIFSGVVKTKENIRTALKYPVDIITIESELHLNELLEALDELVLDSGFQKMMEGKKRHIKVLPRLGSGAQFGIDEVSFEGILYRVLEDERLKLSGIHYFTGTQKKSGKYEKELLMLKELITGYLEKLSEDFFLEYGPGLSVPYFTKDDFEKDLDEVSNLANFIKSEFNICPVTIELGRYIAASCGVYITRIMDIKKAGEMNYILVDGGIHQINYYGQNMAMNTPVIEHLQIKIKGKNEEAEASSKNAACNKATALNENADIEEAAKFMICGSLCTFADLLVRNIPLNNPSVGDILIFKNAGAYSVTEAPNLFLSRELPALYLYNDRRGFKLIRKSIPSYVINTDIVNAITEGIM